VANLHTRLVLFERTTRISLTHLRFTRKISTTITMATRARELEKLIAPIKDKLKAFIKARLDSVVNADKIATAHSALMEAIGAERQNHSVSNLLLSN
jgi:hypothetical protein